MIAFGEARGGLPSDPAAEPPPRLEPRALVVLEETLRPDAAETVPYMRDQQVDLKLISGDARETVTAVAHAVGVPEDAHVIEGPDLPDDKGGLAQAALRNTVFCRITPEQKKALVAALTERGRFMAMIGDGVNDVPALKQARLAVAMGSGSQITKGVADIVLLRDQFSMLPRAVTEGRRIARNIHRLGRLYLTKSVYAGFLILLAAIFNFTFPFLPRQLTVAALLTIGIPSFVLALAPSEGPLYRGRLLRALAAFAFPAGISMGIASLLSFFTRRQRLRRHPRRGPHRRDHDAGRARALLHRPARARARTRAHHRAELHARPGRRARRDLRRDHRHRAGALVLRPRGALRRPVVPGARSASRSGSGSPARPGSCPTCSGSSCPRAPSSSPTTAPSRRTRPGPASSTRSRCRGRRRAGSGSPTTQRGAHHRRPDREDAQDVNSHRRTKIVTTIGPATRTSRAWSS